MEIRRRAYSTPRNSAVFKRSLLLTTLALLAIPEVHARGARDFISIAGSSTVYPFSAAVAENFGKANRRFKTPKVEATGTGGGIKLFCSGVGVGTIDVANASRRMKAGEYADCQKNGVKEIVEVHIGFDGIVLAQAKSQPPLRFTLKDVYTALAKTVPDPKNPSNFVANPYRTWKQVNPQLPDVRIEVLGPPPTSGTRDAFVELAMDMGCDAYPSIKALKASDEKRHRQLCQTVREDGAYVEAGENDNLIVQKLIANPRAVGIFGFSFLEENLNSLHGSLIDGVGPEFEAIASGKYPVARSLYMYVKKAHVGVIPGLREFVGEFVSDKAIGEEGYLASKGLIPLPPAQAKPVRADALALKPFKL
jgi:phosphate transport system substrate-binding protein